MKSIYQKGPMLKHYLPKIMVGLMGIAPMAVQAQPKNSEKVQSNIGSQDRVMQIIMEKDAKGKDVASLLNVQGKKVNLSLGSLIDAAATSWMDGAKTPPPFKMDPNAIVLIKLVKTNDSVQAILFDNEKRLEELTLGNLLSAAAQTYPGCTAEQINGKSVDLNLNFYLDDKGDIQAFLPTPDGKEPLNLGVMLKEVVLLLNDCQNLQ